jgi:elongation factor Ts
MYPHHRFIQSYSHHGRVAVLVEFGTETWVVTEQAAFLELTREISMHVAAQDPTSLSALLEQPYARDPHITVTELLTATSKALGERITVTRFSRWENEHAPTPPEPQQPSPPRSPAVIMKFKSAK